MKKLTHEEFVERLLMANKYYANGEFRLLGVYLHALHHIDCECTRCGHIWSTSPTSLLAGHGCYQCRVNARMISQEDFFIRLKMIHDDIVPLDEYKGMCVKIRFKCSHGHVWSAEPHNVLRGSGCPYCADRAVLVGYNDVWTTRPDIAQLMENASDGYKYTKASHDKVAFKCPVCGTVSYLKINDVYNRGFSCSRCADGISYPNKFARALLDQLSVNNYNNEYQPDWLKPFFYDHYFEYNNQKYVLEMDGGIGHGKRQFGSNDRDILGAERDAFKDALALSKNIKVIRVDCDYDARNRFNYIKNSILSSQLGVIFDLSVVDWELCDKLSQRTLVKQACDMYASGVKNLNEIATELHVHKTTVYNYVKIGTKFGWCNYDAKIAIEEAAIHSSQTIPVNIVDDNMNIIYEFRSIRDCQLKCKTLYDIGISRAKIVESCQTHKPYKGFNFRYANETQQNN